MTKHIFISYNRRNAGKFAKKLTSDLKSNNISVCIDIGSNRPGEDFNVNIYENIANSFAFLLILSPGYNESIWCKHELVQALGNRKVKEMIIPILIENSERPKELNPFTHYSDFRNWQNETIYQEKLKELLDVIQTDKVSQDRDEDNSYSLVKKALISAIPNIPSLEIMLHEISFQVYVDKITVGNSKERAVHELIVAIKNDGRLEEFMKKISEKKPHKKEIQRAYNTICKT